MRASVMRVLVAVGVVAAGGLTWTDVVVGAPGHDINVTGDAAKCDKTWGPPCFTPANGTVTSVAVGETVNWHVLDGTHTVTPVDPAAFGGSGDLTGPDGAFSATFDKPGTYTFYCKHHGSVDKDGKTFHGMWGKIEVKGPDTTSTSAPPSAGSPPSSGPPPGQPGPPPPPPPAHPPPSSGPPPSSSGGSGSGSSGGGNGQSAADLGRPWVGPPITEPPPQAPSATRAAAGQSSGSNQDQAPPSSSGGRGNGNGREGNGNANSGPAYVPPDSALVPPIPAFPTPTTAPLAGTPSGAPQGDAVAVLKHEGGGKHRTLVLLVTGFGVGAFAFGVGGWKYAHRASKYWPA